jgi:APA family basic amino acid/polyamine antiporter
MARDGVFFRPVAEVHSRFGTPARAIAIQAVLGSFYVTLGTFEQILGYFVFITVVFLGLTVAGLFVIRRRDDPSPFRTPGYPYTPIFFLALVLLLLVLLGANRPLEAALGTAVVALGIPVYTALFREPANPSREGDT